MSKFNLGKFNIKSSSQQGSITGITDVTVENEVLDVLILRDGGKGESDIQIDSKATHTSLRYASIVEERTIDIEAEAIGTLRKFSDDCISDIVIDSSAIGSLLGTDLLQYNNGLVLRPGQVMEVDLCDFTVTINGDNALHTEGDGSKWFKLFPGDNFVEITTNGYIAVDIFWKDRWL